MARVVTDATDPWSTVGAEDLIERVERFRWQNLTAYARAFRDVHPDRRAIARPFAGGVAAFIEEGSPVNALSAAGLSEPVTDRGLAEVEAFFAAFGSGFQAWVAPNRDVGPFVARAYTGPATIRVFRRPPLPVDTVIDGIAIERVTDDSTAAATAHARLAATAFGSPTPAMVRLFATFFAVPGARLYRATIDGETAGVGRLLIQDDVADLGGGATLAEFRGRGVQAAMLRHRIDEALRAGCSLLITEAEPDSASTRNILRAGFEPAFDYSVFGSPPGAA